MAATTLSGLLQCNFLTMDGPMQTHFEQLCKMRLPKKRKRDLGSVVDTIPSGGKGMASARTIHVGSRLGGSKCSVLYLHSYSASASDGTGFVLWLSSI